MNTIKKVQNRAYLFNDVLMQSHYEDGRTWLRIAGRNGGDIYVFNDDNYYPKYFFYEDSWDMHFVGQWVEISKEKYLDYVTSIINEKFLKIDSLKREIKELQAEFDEFEETDEEFAERTKKKIELYYQRKNNSDDEEDIEDEYAIMRESLGNNWW